MALLSGQRRSGFRTCLRPLDRDHGQIATLDNLHLEVGPLLAQPSEVFRTGSSVDHQTEPAWGRTWLGQAISDQIVDDAAILSQHAAIERLTGNRQTCDVIG